MTQLLAIPGYQIEPEPIGKGGSSEVFRATRQRDDQTVAIKLLDKKYSEDPSMRQRLKREAELLQHLRHPNVVQIFQRGMCNERIFLVMEYLDKGSLGQYRHLLPRQRLKIMIQVCEGACFIHERGVVHRDLKPSNIMFGSDGLPRIVDFGISLFTNEEHTRLTRTNMVMGTLSYMSPEQQNNPAKVDHRTDIYALGAILYEIFTGHKPVGRFRNPRELDPDFDLGLENVMLKAMSYEIEERYQSVADMKQDLLECWRSGLFAESGGDTPESFDNRIGYWIAKLSHGRISERTEARTRITENAMPEDIPALLKIYQTHDFAVRAALLPVFAKLKDKTTLPTLHAALTQPALSQDAANALVELGSPKSLDAMATVVKKHEVYSYYSLEPIAKLGGEKYLKFVLPYLKSDSFAERDAALKAMEAAASKKWLKDLKKYLKAEKETQLRNRAYLLVQRLEIS